MKVLLDTNAYTRFARGEQVVLEPLRDASKVLVSSVVAGELIQGFRGGKRYEQNLASLVAFLQEPFVEFLAVSLVTAEHYGRIAAQLRKKGRPIPQNDVWIAAHALQAGAELWSFDSQFNEVEGLTWRHFSQ